MLFSIAERKAHVLKGINLLEQATKTMNPPLITHIITEYGKDPFLILIACLLSLRARDVFTIHICRKLFDLVKTPEELVNIPLEELQNIVKPLNFYVKKTSVLLSVCHELIEKFNSTVPHTQEDLLSIKGVGPKTAALVLGQAFDVPAICVDTHVHRISNRLGWVQSQKPSETEAQLKQVVPIDKWIELNYLLVVWGQNICTPLSPLCSLCVLSSLCPKIGVITHR
jgi:endonuclease III